MAVLCAGGRSASQHLTRPRQCYAIKFDDLSLSRATAAHAPSVFRWVSCNWCCCWLPGSVRTAAGRSQGADIKADGTQAADMHADMQAAGMQAADMHADMRADMHADMHADHAQEHAHTGCAWRETSHKAPEDGAASTCAPGAAQGGRAAALHLPQDVAQRSTWRAFRTPSRLAAMQARVMATVEVCLLPTRICHGLRCLFFSHSVNVRDRSPPAS